MARVHRRQTEQKRRKKMGSSVAYKTRGTFLSQEDGTRRCQWAGHRPMQCSGHVVVRRGLGKPGFRFRGGGVDRALRPDPLPQKGLI